MSNQAKVISAPIQDSAMQAFTPIRTGLLQRKCACGQHTVAGGECAECSKKNEGMMQRAAVNVAPTSAVPPIVHDVLSSSGQPLDMGTRAFMEPRFGHDFSGVQVHTDGKVTGAMNAPDDADLVHRPIVERLQQEFEDLRSTDLIHKPLIEQFRRQAELPPGGIDKFGQRIGPSDAEIKYGGLGVKGLCPSGMKIDRIIDATPQGLAKGYRTGYGIVAVMRVFPDEASGRVNLNGSSVVESVTERPSSTSCLKGISICQGSSQFFIGDPVHSDPLGDLPGTSNCFYDHHRFRWNRSILHDRKHNPTDMDSCQRVCDQQYLCDGKVIGRYAITFNLSKSTYDGHEVTRVDVTKT